MTQNGTEEMPVFDWDNVSIDDYFNFMAENNKLVEIQMIVNQDIDDNATDKERRAIARQQSKALLNMQIVMKTMRDMMAKSLVSVPRSWLVNSAPDDIAPGELLGFVKKNKYNLFPQIYLSEGAEEPKN